MSLVHTVSDFVPGLELSRRFFNDVVLSLLSSGFPELQYGAGLLGPGSEILGFDTAMSMDHDWGVRIFLFLRDEDQHLADSIASYLSHHLPSTFLGFPVSLPTMPRTDVRALHRKPDGPVKHHVIPLTTRSFARLQLGFDLSQELSPTDWLTIPSHCLGEMVAGNIYHDATGEITSIRHTLTWYPHDVWLYLLAAGWQRIGQEEHLMPRAGFVGDELGSSIIGSRLVRDVMNLCFLIERVYAPYSKWFGTAFARLKCAGDMGPHLVRAQRAGSWQERESALSEAYGILARLHNELDITDKLDPVVDWFWDRPFKVIKSERFVAALLAKIQDPEVKRLCALPMIGNVNQWSDNTDMEHVERTKMARLYT